MVCCSVLKKRGKIDRISATTCTWKRSRLQQGVRRKTEGEVVVVHSFVGQDPRLWLIRLPKIEVLFLTTRVVTLL